MAKTRAQLEQIVSRLLSNLGDVFETSTPSIEEISAKLGVELLKDLLCAIQSVIAALLGVFSELLLLFTDGINQPIQVPVLSALYRKISGSKMTILDVMALLLAIPTTIVFKLITGKTPKHPDNIGELIKPNSNRAELDARMGRVRSRGNAAIFETSGRSATFTNDSSAFQMKSANSVAALSASPTSKVFDQKRKDAEYNLKQFIASGSAATNIIKMGLPIGEFFFNGFWSWPRTFKPETGYSAKRACASAAAKLIFWLFEFTSIAKKSPANVSDFNFKKPWNEDTRFAKRFVMWCFGGLPVIGALAGRKISYILGLFSNIRQILMLAILHIESWAVGAGYSVYSAVEKWVKIAGETCTNIRGLLQGWMVVPRMLLPWR